MPEEKKTAQVSDVRIVVKLGDSGTVVPQSQIQELSIVSELDHPDTCAVTLNRSGIKAQVERLNPTDKVTVKLAHHSDKSDFAFVGELSGIEPAFKNPEGVSGMVIRALNAMHVLSRGKRSRIFGGSGEKISETSIVDQVVKAPQNSPFLTGVDYDGAPPDDLKYDHVYQHNQTDLEFLRWRAARIGYSLLVEDKTLKFRKRSNKKPEHKLQLQAVRVEKDQKATIQLDRFVPRLSTANQVSEVRVRAWQPEKRKELVCIAKAGDPKVPASLGKVTGTKATAEKHPDAAVVRVDIPFASKEEGEALAISLLNERLMSHVTAEGSVPGDPSLKAGLLVTIDVGKDVLKGAFNGTYLITYVRHWYRHEGAGSRFTTDFRARRDAIDKPTAETREEPA